VQSPICDPKTQRLPSPRLLPHISGKLSVAPFDPAK
jgi:hypothetical protein